MDDGGRWLPDPTGRWAERWFDGAEWTTYVRDRHGSAAVDPLPAELQRPPRFSAPPRVLTRISGLAVASFVLGLIWFGGVASILAIVFGALALGQIRNSAGAVTGRRLAGWGLGLGIAGVVSIPIVMVAATATRENAAPVRITATTTTESIEPRQTTTTMQDRRDCPSEPTASQSIAYDGLDDVASTVVITASDSPIDIVLVNSEFKDDDVDRTNTVYDRSSPPFPLDPGQSHTFTGSMPNTDSDPVVPSQVVVVWHPRGSLDECLADVPSG